MGLFDRDFTGNKAVYLANQLRFEAPKTHFWGKFAKFNTRNKAGQEGVPVAPGNNPRPTNSPIVMQYELKRKQGDVMEIPMLRRLVGKPTYGLDQLEGYEERQKANHVQVPIDILRHGVLVQDGSMSRQTTKDIRLLENAYPQLKLHYGEVSEWEGVSHAFYYGFSKNILASSRYSGDSKIKAISHPHVFIKGQGKAGVDFGTASNYPSTSGYESDIGTAIGNISTGDTLDVAFLQYLKAQPAVRKIMPLIMKDGNPLRFMVVHPYQIHSLENDSAFQQQAATVWAQNYAKENPLLIGCKYVYAGFAIFESDTAVWWVDTSGGDPVYGPKAGATEVASLDDYEDYAGKTIFAGFILGSNAIYKGMGSAFRFKGASQDYEERQGVAYVNLEGYSRGDFWNEDDGTRGQYVVNNGSALFMTYAAQPNA